MPGSTLSPSFNAQTREAGISCTEWWRNGHDLSFRQKLAETDNHLLERPMGGWPMNVAGQERQSALMCRPGLKVQQAHYNPPARRLEIQPDDASEHHRGHDQRNEAHLVQQAPDGTGSADHNILPAAVNDEHRQIRHWRSAGLLAFWIWGAGVSMAISAASSREQPR